MRCSGTGRISCSLETLSHVLHRELLPLTSSSPFTSVHLSHVNLSFKAIPAEKRIMKTNLIFTSSSVDFFL